MLRKLLFATIYSILIFFSISFLTLIFDLHPFSDNSNGSFNLGFPFEYYYQFQLSGSDFPNHGWVFGNFLTDSVITWIMTSTVYFIVKRKK